MYPNKTTIAEDGATWGGPGLVASEHTVDYGPIFAARWPGSFDVPAEYGLLL